MTSLVYHRRVQGRPSAIGPVEHFRNYCTECEWEATTATGLSRQEVSALAVEHHCERGHDIESMVIDRPALDA